MPLNIKKRIQLGTKRIILTAALLCFTTYNSLAQKWSRGGGLSNEIGFTIGSVHFNTDYGQRYDAESNFGNVNVGVGIVHYLTFVDYRYRWNQRTNWFRNHFRFRNEISYFSAKLEHAGEYVEEVTDPSVQRQKLQAMHGEAKNFNVGTQLEYHLLNITKFGSRRSKKMLLSPYASLGIMFSHTSPSLFSDYDDGDWESNPDILYAKWAEDGAVDVEGGWVGSATFSGGTRIRIADYSDIFIEAKWQYFFDDTVDGLDADDDSNKFNDWTTYFHVGYCFYLN